MELWKGKRKIVIATAVLLSVMLLFTLISKSVYAYQLPQITVEEAGKRTVGKRIRLFGHVSQSREYAVSALPGIKTDAVFVTPGDEIEEGTLLFTLNEADLKEQIAARELSVKKLEVQIATLEYNQGLENQKKADQTNRALEDYMDSVSDNNVTQDRALTKEEQARQDLQKHLEDAPQITKNSDRQAARDEYDQWVERGKELQKEVERLTDELKEAEKQVEAAQKAYDEAKAAAGGVSFAEETVYQAADEKAAKAEEHPTTGTEEPVESAAEEPEEEAAPDNESGTTEPKQEESLSNTAPSAPEESSSDTGPSASDESLPSDETVPSNETSPETGEPDGEQTIPGTNGSQENKMPGTEDDSNPSGGDTSSVLEEEDVQ